MTRRGKIVLAKAGLDGHDVGMRLVARALTDAGFEVVYLGKRVTTNQTVAAAIAEDADAVGISVLSGGLGHFAVQVRRALDARDMPIPVLAGGIDEPAEIDKMLLSGVTSYVGPGSSSAQIVAAFTEAMREHDDP
jgi:methylmalonyl-CoA mutase C-terminal domain/subunit